MGAWLAEGGWRGGLVRVVKAALSAAVALAAATALIAGVEAEWIGVPDASPIYLLAVVAVGIRQGTWPSIATAGAAFFLYNLLFVAPRFTLQVGDPAEWVNLVLFLIVAVVIGRLTALQAERQLEASRRARESQALFAISRTLATAPSLAAAAPLVVARLTQETRMTRLWIGLTTDTRESVLADTDPGAPRPNPPTTTTLMRGPGDEPARWVGTHEGRPRGRAGRAEGDGRVFRVKVEVEGEHFGFLWATRPRAAGEPTRDENRLLSLAADQIALGLKREELSREATEAEVARQSEALKSALLDSVSHDLRTPLASIRAAAGSLMDPAVTWSAEEQREVAGAIDRETERLDRLVRNLLDLSRIEAGALRPDLEVFVLVELVEPVVERLGPVLEGHPLEVRISRELPPVLVDGVFLDEVLTNLLENAARHAGPGTPIRVGASDLGETVVEVVVEDGGVGVPAELLPRLFTRFYRVPRRREGGRRGMGVGLAVVKGLVEAMGGTILAERSELGGLAVRVRVAAAPAAAPELGG